jgi:hypothetical protein
MPSWIWILSPIGILTLNRLSSLAAMWSSAACFSALIAFFSLSTVAVGLISTEKGLSSSTIRQNKAYFFGAIVGGWKVLRNKSPPATQRLLLLFAIELSPSRFRPQSNFATSITPRPARFSTFCNLFLDAEIEIYPSISFVFHDFDMLQVTLASWHGPSTTTKAIARLD